MNNLYHFNITLSITAISIINSTAMIILWFCVKQIISVGVNSKSRFSHWCELIDLFHNDVENETYM